jgi:hypothetical protein
VTALATCVVIGCSLAFTQPPDNFDGQSARVPLLTAARRDLAADGKQIRDASRSPRRTQKLSRAPTRSSPPSRGETGGRLRYLVTSRFLRSGSRALQAVVDTRGKDIPHLLRGLDVVRKAIVFGGFALFALLTV